MTRITAASFTTATQASVGYCEVAGYVEPRIEFLLRLPGGAWNGKFVELGCGGPCGTLAHVKGCETPLRRGYACIVSDGGHKVEPSQPMKWAQGNPQAPIEYFARASHVTALAGKSIVRSYYGKDARKSYFMGCSAGGVQAMWLAQKFPWEFDGIVAGGPALSLSRIWLNWLWANRALVGADGKSVLEERDLQLLHRAALQKCDLTDGAQDGVIGDPKACRFTPKELQCIGGRSGQCLTENQVAAASKIYGGPVTSRGEQVAAPIAIVGSELTWSQFFAGSETHPTGFYTYLRAWPLYSTFELNLGPSWKPADFNFDRDYKRLGAMEGLEPLFHPDLRRFNAAGAKLIVYTGWNDAIEGVHNTTEYYETAEKIVGSRTATQEFLRLFVVPGMNHCGGGDGASTIDWLSYIEGWVENGQAPDVISGAHVRSNELDLTVEDGRRELERRNTFPLRAEDIAFTRPIYPYPDVAKYKGQGDPNDAVSFKRARVQ